MLNKTLATFGVLGLVLLILAIFIVGPWISILAVNQLFNTAIPLTFWNWLSVFWLHFIVASSSSKKS